MYTMPLPFMEGKALWWESLSGDVIQGTEDYALTVSMLKNTW